jgi:hypothetical protein
MVGFIDVVDAQIYDLLVFVLSIKVRGKLWLLSYHIGGTAPNQRPMRPIRYHNPPTFIARTSTVYPISLTS